MLTIYGNNCVVTATRTQMVVRDGAGNIREQTDYEDNRPNCMAELLKNFALHILLPDNNKLTSTGRENLKNMAVMESAYLSARTGFPEVPAKILQMTPGTAGAAPET